MRLKPFDALIIALFLTLFVTSTYGTYHEKSAVSSNGRFRIEAKLSGRFSESGDLGRGNDRWCFTHDFLAMREKGANYGKSVDARKDGFSYTMTDLPHRKVLWRRRQLEDEGHCFKLHVSDSAWTVIITYTNELIVITPHSKETGRLILHRDALPRDETGILGIEIGRWVPASLWYFYRDAASKRDLFVGRFWWGDRIVVDLQTAKLVEEYGDLKARLDDRDRKYVLWVLDTGVKTRRNWENKKDSVEAALVFDAAFLAGKMRLREAVPLLKDLQDVPAITSTDSTDWHTGFREEDGYKPSKGRISPYYWNNFGIRQAAQVSLRRLGEKPRQYDCTQFCGYKGAGRMGKPYVYEPPKVPRAHLVKSIKQGLTPEEVLELIGAPDYVWSRYWLYEIASAGKTLYVGWTPSGSAGAAWGKESVWTTERVDELLLE